MRQNFGQFGMKRVKKIKFLSRMYFEINYRNLNDSNESVDVKMNSY